MSAESSVSSRPDAGESELYEVRLLDYPLPVFVAAQEHIDDLVRELTLIANSEAVERGSSDLPVRFLQLVEQLTHQYGGVSDDVENERDDAIERGETSIDLTYHVPGHIAPAVIHLGDMLDEADEYCRQGEHLLTLATPPEYVAFRRWAIGQFVAQIEQGAAPTSWPQYTAAHGL